MTRWVGPFTFCDVTIQKLATDLRIKIIQWNSYHSVHVRLLIELAVILIIPVWLYIFNYIYIGVYSIIRSIGLGRNMVAKDGCASRGERCLTFPWELAPNTFLSGQIYLHIFAGYIFVYIN